MKDKWKNLESSKREVTHYIQGSSVRLIADDLLETMEARKQWLAHAKCWKERDQTRILYSPKLSFENKCEIKMFSNNQILRKSVTRQYTLQEILKEVLQAQKKGH